MQQNALALGILGGTFDPIHYAHLFIAETARTQLNLDRILFLPTNNPRHRSDEVQAPLLDRLAMIRSAIASNPFFALDESDVEPDATGYTADVLPKLRRRYPNASLTFIVGSDSLLDTPWQRFDNVLAHLDTLAVALRPGKPLDTVLASLEPQARAKIRPLDLPSLAISATMIRSLASKGAGVRYLVPGAVARRIAENTLYKPPTREPAL